jgi:hypothetical protein
MVERRSVNGFAFSDREKPAASRRSGDNGGIYGLARLIFVDIFRDF